MRAALAPLIPAHAAFDGWGDEALARAAGELGLDPAQARLAFPDGAAGMIDAWFAAIDMDMAAAFPPERVAAMKIRDRIRALLLFRLDALRPQREAARRALATLAQPRHAARGAKLGWRAADLMWRAAGDASTDISFYTRRATLAGVHAATLLATLDDDDEAAAAAFLDRRLAGVMRFEKLKAQLAPDPDRRFSMARLLGRLRYPAR